MNTYLRTPNSELFCGVRYEQYINNDLSIGGELWNQCESWIHCNASRARLRKLDVEEIINEAFYRWWKASVERKATIPITESRPRLFYLLRCSLRDAIRYQARSKRNARESDDLTSVEAPQPTFAQQWIDVEDTLNILSPHLDHAESEILRSLLAGSSLEDVQRKSGLDAAKLRTIRRRIG